MRVNKIENNQFKCPLCSEFRQLYLTKKEKHYLICNDCGVQLFIRKEEGINRLKKIIQSEGGSNGSWF